MTEPGTWTWDVTVPAGGRLHLGVESFARARVATAIRHLSS